jgi:exodeoxyribonuclease VII small subunit
MAKTSKAIDQLSYEQALKELDDILEELESESRGLDETMALYERGRSLIQHCQTLLDQAELKVSQLDENGKLKEIKAQD